MSPRPPTPSLPRRQPRTHGLRAHTEEAGTPRAAASAAGFVALREGEIGDPRVDARPDPGARSTPRHPELRGRPRVRARELHAAPRGEVGGCVHAPHPECGRRGFDPTHSARPAPSSAARPSPRDATTMAAPMKPKMKPEVFAQVRRARRRRGLRAAASRGRDGPCGPRTPPRRPRVRTARAPTRACAPPTPLARPAVQCAKILHYFTNNPDSRTCLARPPGPPHVRPRATHRELRPRVPPPLAPSSAPARELARSLISRVVAGACALANPLSPLAPPFVLRADPFLEPVKCVGPPPLRGRPCGDTRGQPTHARTHARARGSL